MKSSSGKKVVQNKKSLNLMEDNSKKNNIKGKLQEMVMTSLMDERFEEMKLERRKT